MGPCLGCLPSLFVMQVASKVAIDIEAMREAERKALLEEAIRLRDEVALSLQRDLERDCNNPKRCEPEVSMVVLYVNVLSDDWLSWVPGHGGGGV